MIPSVSASGRALVMASLLVLAVTACGRRGPLEPPPDPAAAAVQRQREEIRRQRQGAIPTGGAVAGQTEIPPIATARRSEATPPTPDEDEADELPSSIAPTPIPTPSSSRKRGITIPKDPFILDPLL
jgi:predicted small lipoprotein YifL